MMSPIVLPHRDTTAARKTSTAGETSHQPRPQGTVSKSSTTTMSYLIRFVAILLFCLLTAPGVFAADPAGCDNATTTAAMQACESARYTEANQKLNAVYSRLMKTLDPSKREKLRAAQLAWIQFRDKNAAFMASAAEGGTLAPLIQLTTSTSMTEARAAELTKFGQP
jgi:uncharacterized protein YecT (DUF1311 family)